MLQEALMGETRKTRSIRCVECNQPTSHDILFSEEVGGVTEDGDIHFGSEYQTVKCRGCGTVSFAVISWNSEETDDRGQPFVSTVLYPSRSSRKPIENQYSLPTKVLKIYLETLTALGNKAPTLAAIVKTKGRWGQTSKRR
jgi:hypothetical protein